MKELLTGQAKIDFEAWYKLWNVANCTYDKGITIVTSDFYNLPETMQQGVLLEFFRGRGIEIVIYLDTYEKNNYKFDIWVKWRLEKDGRKDTYPDYNTVFTHAIQKACEIYNGGVK